MILHPTYVSINLRDDGMMRLGFEVRLEAPTENAIDRTELTQAFDLCRQLKLVEVKFSLVDGLLRPVEGERL